MRVHGGNAAALREGGSENSGGCERMESYTIRLIEDAGHKSCPKCGQGYLGRCGLGLFAAEHAQPVCRSCGKKGAPTMAALLDLAHTAERGGKSWRRLFKPPME
jgi:ribosomal protein S27AE